MWHLLQDNVSTLGGAGNNNPESEQQTWLGTVFSDMTWEPNACIKTGNAASTKRALLLHILAWGTHAKCKVDAELNHKFNICICGVYNGRCVKSLHKVIRLPLRLASHAVFRL